MTTTENQAPTIYTSERLAALADALVIFPDLPAPELMEIVDWALREAAGLNPEALELAAKALTKADGSEWTSYLGAQSKYRGLATHAIATYLAAAK